MSSPTPPSPRADPPADQPVSTTDTSPLLPPHTPQPSSDPPATTTPPQRPPSHTNQTWAHNPPPPTTATRPIAATSQSLTTLSISHREFNTHASVSPSDGRVHITVNAHHPGPASQRIMSALNEPDLPDVISSEASHARAADIRIAPPKLNIVIMVIGSRGDVQPFMPIARCLREEWGHRVRLATHGAFREFVEGEGVEFFDVGGDPEELMAFMVKNPGLLPNVETIRAGEVARRREQMAEMFEGFWRACVEPSDGRRKRGARPPDSARNSAEDWEEEEEAGEEELVPFVADAIIANPPSFAHVHCAEKLGVPLHLMFTFPYSPTQSMPHPLAFIQNSNLTSEAHTNALTYPLVEMMTWQGLGDLVNSFRKNTLFLEPVATLWAPGMISRLRVPFTYMWSPALIPKPADWGDNIDITGFVFGQSPDYEPPKELQEFLDAGEPPIYIGFGSIVIDDPKQLTQTIFDAVKATGVRALVSKGWGNLGEGFDVPENIHLLGNTPHNWLFSRVSAVIHHGGAGTTAIGLYHGKPTMVVPFFGDQAFWGQMIVNAGAGAPPCPHKDLTAERFTEGIEILLKEETRAKAQEISRKIREEDGDGAQNAVRSFYKGLQEMDNKGKRGLGYSGLRHGEGGPMGPGEGKWGSGGPGIRCDILEDRVAVWRVRRTRVRISALAASWYVQHNYLTWKDLRLVRHTEWNDYDGPGEPFSGGLSAFFATLTNIAKGIVGIPRTLIHTTRRADLPADPHPPADTPPLADDLAAGTKHSLKKIARSVARAPMDVSLAVAQGFHNAPRLYNDPVRRPVRITGFHSGMRAAGKELALGIYDGVTGVVTQPYRGARRGGVLGAVKGVGKGLGGLFFKTQAGTAGVVGYSLKGVHRELRKGRDRAVLERVMEARRRQGEVEMRAEAGGVEERLREGWEVVRREREGEEAKGAVGRLRERRREARAARAVERERRGERVGEFNRTRRQRREIRELREWREEMRRGERGRAGKGRRHHKPKQKQKPAANGARLDADMVDARGVGGMGAEGLKGHHGVRGIVGGAGTR